MRQICKMKDKIKKIMVLPPTLGTVDFISMLHFFFIPSVTDDYDYMSLDILNLSTYSILTNLFFISCYTICDNDCTLCMLELNILFFHDISNSIVSFLFGNQIFYSFSIRFRFYFLLIIGKTICC